MTKKYIFQGIGLGAVIIFTLFLARVFSGQILVAQSFSIGNFEIHYYGLILAASILTAYSIARRRLPLYKISPADGDELMFYGLVGGFIGARMYHIFSDIHFYVQKPLEMLMVWHGGLSIYGGVLGGLLGAYFYYRAVVAKNNNMMTFLTIADWLTPSLLIGQIIGRFGNLFNYELFGYPTNVLWKMYVPFRFRPPEYLTSAYFHPLFLYESLANILILFFLLQRQKKMRQHRHPGTLFFLYILLYNIIRLLLEFMRIDSVRIAGLRQNALVSLFLVLATTAYLIYNFRHEATLSSSR